MIHPPICPALAMVAAAALLAATLPTAAVAAAPAPVRADLARTTFISDMDGEFRKRDADRDGRISRAELETWERNQAIAAAQARNRAEFQRLDVDRNGALTPGEFAALTPLPGFVDVSPLMARFDPNRDQAVTLIEFRAATLANFDRLDADHDGVVTAAEASAGGTR